MLRNVLSLYYEFSELNIYYINIIMTVDYQTYKIQHCRLYDVVNIHKTPKWNTHFQRKICFTSSNLQSRYMMTLIALLQRLDK